MQISRVLSLVASLAAAANATIVSGVYKVTSNLTGKEEQAVGRSFLEDTSLNPKEVRYGDSSDVDSTWIVRDAGDGSFHLINSGWPVGVENKLLWAFYSGENAEQTWDITPDVRRGGNAYIVQSRKTGGGWTVVAEGEQISVDYLVAGPSMPPFFPSYEVFYFTPIGVIGGSE